MDCQGRSSLRIPRKLRSSSEGISQNLDRLRLELTAAAPDVIVTLGNAALRVLRKLLGDDTAPTKLTPADYGTELSANLNGRRLRWLLSRTSRATVLCVRSRVEPPAP